MTEETVEIGQRLKDGWVVAGVSPDNNDVFSIEPLGAAEEKKVRWLVGTARGLKLSCEGHKDARLPSLEELKVVFNNRASLYDAHLQRPNQTASSSTERWDDAGSPTGSYWSSTLRRNKLLANVVCMTSGVHYGWKKNDADHYARCVRTEPNLRIK